MTCIIPTLLGVAIGFCVAKADSLRNAARLIREGYKDGMNE